MLFDKVLVPVDLSEVSSEQIECAGHLRAYGMKELVILFVLTNGEVPSVTEQEKLRNLAKLVEESGVRVRVVTEKGKPAPTILKIAKKEKVTLIAMASSGKTKATELVIGSVSLSVVRQAHVPVMVGKFSYSNDPRSSPHTCPLLLDQILVSLDLGRSTQVLMDLFKELDGSGCKKAVLFHVVPSAKYSVEDNNKFEEVKRDLAKWRETHKGTSELDTHVHYGTPAYNIIEAAREIDASLIVVGNEGKGLLHSMTLGSVSDEVLRKSPVHVLIVPF
jgi:nucleotide-binding universal stress UspA family protein